MERRKGADRRQVHVFVSNDRRNGPHDRRGDEFRRRERAREREKIERIQAFKEKAKAPSSAAPMITKKRLLCVGLAILVAAAIIILLQ